MNRPHHWHRPARAAGRIAPATLAVLALAAIAAWWLLADDAEGKVRAAHADLADLLSKPEGAAEGLPIARIRGLESLFAETCAVTGDAGMFAGIHSRQSLVQQVLAVHGALDRAELSFGELDIAFPDDDTAVVRFTAELTASDVAHGALLETRRVESRMQRIDGDWLFVAFDLEDVGPAVAARDAIPIPVRDALTADAHFLRTNVIGDDDRELAPLSDADLIDAVGLVTCDRVVDGRRHFGRGTGTLVGSRSTVLTVAHVLSSNAERSGSSVKFDPVTECSFRQYDADGELRAEVGFAHATFGAFRESTGRPDEDWAVLLTAEPLPATTMPLPFAAFDPGELDSASRVPISIVAFHADVRSRIRAPLKSDGRLFAIDYAGFTRLAHTADMGRMSSGAAIVRRTADGRGVVIGVHRSAANLGEFNLGVPIASSLYATLRGFADDERPQAGAQLAALETTSRRW